MVSRANSHQIIDNHPSDPLSKVRITQASAGKKDFLASTFPKKVSSWLKNKRVSETNQELPKVFTALVEIFDPEDISEGTLDRSKGEMEKWTIQ